MLERVIYCPLVTASERFAWEAYSEDNYEGWTTTAAEVDDAEIGTVIGQISSRQPNVEFGIAGGNIGNKFGVNNDTGEIFINEPLDYEQIDVYTEVKVWDPESPTDWQMYRASPFIAGKPWHDWAVLNLEGINLPPLWDGKDLTYIPSQIKCIFDFTGLENDNGLDMEPSIYALIEPMCPNDDDEFEATASDLFESWKKGPSNTELESGNYIVIVDLMERILEPTTVIPDLDNDCDRAYLRMLPLCQWSSVFEEWLEADHTRDFDEPQERQPQTQKTLSPAKGMTV